MKLTEQELLKLAKDLTEALDDIIDGSNCYYLSSMTGWSNEYCQTNFIDLVRFAKDTLSE